MSPFRGCRGEYRSVDLTVCLDDEPVCLGDLQSISFYVINVFLVQSHEGKPQEDFYDDV